MKNTYSLLLLICLIATTHEIKSQISTKKLITIEQMFALADSNNRSIKMYSTAIEQSESMEKSARNAYLPNIETSLSIGYNGNGIITDRDFSNSFTANIPHYGNNFSIEVSQVIFGGGAIKNMVKTHEIMSQIAILNAENNRQNIRLLIAGNYLELCKLTNQIQVFDCNIDQTKKIIDNMNSRYNEGATLQNDITRYELQLQNMEYSKIQIQNEIKILNNELTTALGLPKTTIIIPDTNNLSKMTTPESSDYWEKQAMSSIVLRSCEANVQMNKYAEKIAHSERYPKVALFAGDYMNGPITIEIPAIDKNFNYWLVGVGIKYDISNIYKSSKTIESSKLSVKLANEQLSVAEEQITNAIQTLYIKYCESYSLLNIKQKSCELAKENYEVISNRYKNDLALITDLLDASAQKLDAELQVVNSKINVIFNYFKIKHILGTL